MEKLNVWLHQLNNFGKRKTFFQNFPIIALKTNRSLKPGTPVQWNRNKAVGTAVDKRVEFFPVFLPTDHFFFSLSRSYFDVRAGQPCPRCVRGESGPSKSRSSDFCGFFYSPLRPGQREIREPTTAKTRSKVSFLPLRPRIRLHNATVYVSRRTRSYDFFCNESSAFSALIYYALVIWKVNRRNKRYRNRK